MSLPALEDIPIPLEGVTRIETSPRQKATPIIMDMMRSVYPHDQVFGEYCTVNDYIDCPPDELLCTWLTHAASGRGHTACAVSPPPMSRVCGWPTTGSVRRPRSTPAPSSTSRRGPSITTARGIRA